MALHGLIEVNGYSIGFWSAQRLGDNVVPSPDDVMSYACEVHQNGDLTHSPSIERFTLEHRFGDGALTLAAKVLNKARGM